MRRRSPVPLRGRQRGIATILILLLLGLVVGGTVFTMSGALRGAQERQLTVHSATAAQGAAWRGVEAIRTALLQLPEDRYIRWTNGEGWDRRDSAPAAPATASAAAATPDPHACQGTPVRGAIAVSGTDPIAVPRATITEVCRLPGAGAYRVTVEVTGRAAEGTAATTATVEAVYLITLPTAGSPTPSPGAATVGGINIYRDLLVTGGIVFRGRDATINVDGNVTLDAASISGIDTIRSTGNVSIGSGIQVDTVEADGNVTLTGAARVSQIRARGNVRIEGGARPMSIRSDGTVTFVGGDGDVVQAKGDVIVTGGGVHISSITTEGSVRWSGTGGGAGSVLANGSIDYAGNNRLPTTLSAAGEITVRGSGATTVHAGRGVRLLGWGHTGQVQAGGDVVLQGSASAGSVTSRGNVSMEGSGSIGTVAATGSLYVGGWQSVSGTIGGTLRRQQQYNSLVRVTVQPGFQAGVAAVRTASVAALPAVTVPRTRVDAWPLRESANYVFEHVGGRIQVTVQHVQGIESGTYVLGERATLLGRFPDHLCRPEHMSGATCTRPVATLCQGFSAYNSCFSWRNGLWEVNGTSMARGVAWFNGNLEVGNGTYINTFIATGNITTAGANRTMAPNWAGYARTCANAPLLLLPNPDFAGLVPTNLCDADTRRLSEAPVANAAFIAGGYMPGTDAYAGGRINLAAATHISGTVSAGDNLITGGATRIDGAIIVGAQSGAGGRATIGGATIIDTDSGDAAWDPGVLPCMDGSCDPPTPTADPEAAVLWTRYR